MYISIYDKNLEHIANITDVSFDLTQRAFDMDTFNAKGAHIGALDGAKVFVLNEENGKQIYSGLLDESELIYNSKSIKGLDFKKLLDRQVFVAHDSNILYNIFIELINSCFVDEIDALIPINLFVDDRAKEIDTTLLFGKQTGEIIIDNVLDMITNYIKVYQYKLEMQLDIVSKKILIKIEKNDTTVDIALSDFQNVITTTKISTNKTVACRKFATTIIDGLGQEHTSYEYGQYKYYYILENNDLIESDVDVVFENRIYPVISKIYVDEFIAKAQFEAVFELANNRYNDNIEITELPTMPIDLSSFGLLSFVNVYVDKQSYKTLPLTEIRKVSNEKGNLIEYKLGFAKILLTEIIKQNQRKR